LVSYHTVLCLFKLTFHLTVLWLKAHRVKSDYSFSITQYKDVALKSLPKAIYHFTDTFPLFSLLNYAMKIELQCGVFFPSSLGVYLQSIKLWQLDIFILLHIAAIRKGQEYLQSLWAYIFLPFTSTKESKKPIIIF